MSGLGLYLLCFIVPFLIGLAVQGWLKSTVGRTMRVPLAGGLSGAEVARAILDANGLHGVPVQASRAGVLSDHYDPRTRSVSLSAEVYSGRSVAAAAIAAHEAGHAIQHARAYVPMTVRSAIWPLAAFGSQAWIFLLLAGVLFNAFGLVQLALLVFAAVVLFQIVTLPVEFDASRRALGQLQELGLVSGGEVGEAKATLTAAAMTYVAAALAAIAQLLYFLAVFGRR